MSTTILALSDQYRRAIFFTLLGQQVPLAFLSLLMLDLGQSARICGIAMIGFWTAAALIMARRPDTPGASDLFFLRWGFVPVLLLTGALATLV
ncbi:MAG TPA: hypothetical protein VFT74_15055 [Isosphaeraceae bacterium]|jgi:hypothetical protein|nr:hypothetical protein [Isosphaeraceae bacterium]